MSKWIDVNNRLPEKDTDVLVCFDDGFMATVFFGEDFDLWTDSGEPIAWMPLPEPYKLPKKKQFSQDTLNFFKCIDKKYKWIAKDKSGLICTFVSKPIKTEKLWSDDGWSNGESYASLEAIKNSLFTEIKWEDEEPIYIDEYVER